MNIALRKIRSCEAIRLRKMQKIRARRIRRQSNLVPSHLPIIRFRRTNRHLYVMLCADMQDGKGSRTIYRNSTHIIKDKIPFIEKVKLFGTFFYNQLIVKYDKNIIDNWDKIFYHRHSNTFNITFETFINSFKNKSNK